MITRSGRVEKSPKKKNFSRTFFHAVFLFLVLKMWEKRNSFRLCDQRRGKIWNKLFFLKNCFYPSGPFLIIFFSEISRKRWLGSVSGVRRRSRELKKKYFQEKGVKPVFYTLWVWKTECVWVGVCVCSRDHGGKNIICKKCNLRVVSGIFEHF